MVQLAEEDLNKGHIFDSARQEMLNHATKWVNDAETERSISEREHARTSAAYSKAERKVFQLHQELRRAIIKTKPYFELKAQLNQALENQRKNINQIEEKVIKIKLNYSETLRNLEKISEEIHQKRKLHDSQQLEERRIEGVGAESPINSENSYITKYEIHPKFKENFEQQSENKGFEKFSCNCKLQRNTSNENINIINDDVKEPKSVNIDDRETVHQTIQLNDDLLQKFGAFDLSSNECKIYDQKHLSEHKLYHKPFEGNEENSDTDSLKSTDTLDDDQVESLLIDTYFLHKIMK